MRAAVEEISISGWGRVTTRAVAERAGLPHGSVSYHFRGKEELLTEAALGAIEAIFPVGEISTLETLEDLTPMIRSRLSGEEVRDSVSTGLLMEAMRESERNPALRERLSALLSDYRRVLVDIVSRSDVESGVTPTGVAALIAAVGDGLLLHALLDPNLDVAEAVETLITLLRKESES